MRSASHVGPAGHHTPVFHMLLQPEYNTRGPSTCMYMNTNAHMYVRTSNLACSA